MKLNALEFMLMNNPVRALIQDRYEIPILLTMPLPGEIGRALEIGCGNGNGTLLIKKHYRPVTVTGIDLDERMIDRAARRNTDPSVDFRVMDAARLDFPDESFDAVFDFGIIHHIPNWRDCLTEIHRVLRPGGTLVLEELSLESFSHGAGKLWRRVLDHPYDEMFTRNEFLAGLANAGFSVLDFKESHPLRLFKFFSLTARWDTRRA